MLYNLDTEIGRQTAQNRFRQLLDKRVVVELKEKKNRTTSQNSYLHLILGWFGISCGYTLNEAKQIYKLVNKDIYQYTVDRENLKINVGQHFYRSSADLDSAEMTQTIDKFREYSQREANVYLPTPDDRRFLMEIDVEMSKNREYL